MESGSNCNHARDYKIAGVRFVNHDNSDNFVRFLLLNIIKVLVRITDRSRYDNNTNTGQNKTLFRNESQIS